MNRTLCVFGTLGLALAFAPACSKDDKPDAKPAVSATAEPAAPSAAPSVTVAEAKSAMPEATQTAPAPAAIDAGLAKTTKDAGSTANVAPSASASAAAAALKPASTRIAGKNFALDVASPGCKAGADCVVTLRVTAAGEYHINKEYPYKFTAAPAPGITFLGKGEPNVFTRAAGDFREEGEKAATMTVRFKPTAPGDAKVSGTYKMSVCSADQCQIEQQAVALAVPVM